MKTSYGASVLIRNEEESSKLAVYQKYVPDIQDALALDPADRPSKRGHLTPMEVMDAPYRAGDLRYGYQAVADNLPNDPRIHQEKGTKKIFFKNFMDARVSYVILPIAQKLMRRPKPQRSSGEGYLARHADARNLPRTRPQFRAQSTASSSTISEAIGPAYSGLGRSQSRRRRHVRPAMADRPRRHAEEPRSKNITRRMWQAFSAPCASAPAKPTAAPK